jgi:hypothetical protein
MLTIFPMNWEAPHLRYLTTGGGASTSPATMTTSQSSSARPVSPVPSRILASPSATSTVARHSSNVNQRPKLSLQTTSLPITFGKSTTGLSRSLTPSSTASPTILNTFNNAYAAARPLSATDEAPSPSRLPAKALRHAPSYVATGHRDHREGTPYQLPLGVRSILRNSPLPRSSLWQTMSASGVPEGRRVFFPAKKQVSYRFPLEEEIKTVRFVARHSDLSSGPEHDSSQGSESDDPSDSSTPGSDFSSSEDETSAITVTSAPPHPSKKRRKTISSERQIRAAALRDGLQEPDTPRQGRRKRCKWRWTLEPVVGPAAVADPAIAVAKTTDSSSQGIHSTCAPDAPNLTNASERSGCH